MNTRRAALLFLFPFAVTVAACSYSARGPTPDASDLVASAGASQHPINGKVVGINAAQHKVTLAHDAIPNLRAPMKSGRHETSAPGEDRGGGNYMDAMTMEFRVKEAWPFGIMATGDTLRGTLVVDGARSWIESVTVAKASGTHAATAPRGSWVPADKGTPLPDVPLIDQDAHPMRLDRYRGHPLLMAFSYSRCPLPDYCPLTMANFARIEKTTADDPALKNLRLLIVTIDPAHDTPAVLRSYGLKYATGDGAGQPFARWNLATGKPEDVKRLASFFGLDYVEEARSIPPITHSLRTVIVDPAGRVYKVFQGNEWKVDEALSALRELAASSETGDKATSKATGT